MEVAIDVATPVDTRTDVTPATHLFEDDSMLIIFVDDKFRNRQTNEIKIIEKAAKQKRWRFWSEYYLNKGIRHGLYLVLIK